MDKTKKKRKRIMCMSLACMLVFSNVSTAYANPLLLLLGGEVARNVAMVGVVSLLGLTGVGVSGYIYENQDNYAEFGEKLVNDFENFCSESVEWASVTSSNIANWLSLVAEGTLNKADATYLALKDWAADLIGRSGSAGTGSDSTYIELSASDVASALNKIDINEFMSNTTQLAKYQVSDYVAMGHSTYIDSGKNSVLVQVDFDDTGSGVVINTSGILGAYSFGATSDYISTSGVKCINGFPCLCTDEIEHCPVFGGEYISSSVPADYVIKVNGTRREALQDLYDTGGMGFVGEIVLATGVINGFSEWDFSMVSENSIVDEIVVDPDIEQVIERDGTLDNVDVVSVDGVQDSVIPVDWDNVQDISKPYPFPDVVPVDNVEGVVIGSDVPIEDIPTLDPTNPTNPTIPQTGYTVSGLETVFPFCIPFDLVKIFTLFKAEPTAPKFNYTFTYYISGNKKTKNIDIDLSKFNTVAELLRTVELIAFMVALTIKTRDLIRG